LDCFTLKMNRLQSSKCQQMFTNQWSVTSPRVSVKDFQGLLFCCFTDAQPTMLLTLAL
jgi:hypothetical protein